MHLGILGQTNQILRRYMQADGVSQMMQVNHSALWAGYTGDYTATGWIWIDPNDPLTSGGTILEKGTTNNYFTITKGSSGAFLQMGTSNVTANRLTTTAITKGVWTPFGFSAKLQAGGSAMDLNGYLGNSFHSKTGVALPVANTANWFAGARNSTTKNPFYGKLAVIRQYQRSMTVSELEKSRYYRYSDNLVAEYLWLEQTGTTVEDTSNNNNPGTMLFSAQWGKEFVTKPQRLYQAA
ncbi:hypothetical protein AHMF7605_10410 [Adhaeribacter arboris]|uniref:Uncharacterized protein n=1 Tax=Adhaeribacter arboris TaxID=2072846 RepID=A0A2T2YEF7_9BACT|nr:hypothetical protein [Adhaeribacter arboris]PSR53900.1 hypothetical protein AHMF7605_10410 [Adhaeribacter arboris]